MFDYKYKFYIPAKGNTDECDFANAFGECIHSKFPRMPRGGH